MKNILYTIILSFLLLSCDITVTNTTADFQAGLDAYQAGDYATALKEFRSLAEQGFADAQYNLAWMYEHGEGVTQDYKKALKWYQLAVEQGDATAGHQLGVMHHYGWGVKTNYKEALRFYRLAAPQVVQSQYSLGAMYYQGQGVNQDIVIAYMWFYVAAENGNPRSKGNINVLAKEMKPKQIAKAEKLARECVEKNYKDCG